MGSDLYRCRIAESCFTPFPPSKVEAEERAREAEKKAKANTSPELQPGAFISFFSPQQENQQEGNPSGVIADDSGRCSASDAH